MTAETIESSLSAWAQEARDLHDVAESLIKTSFVPMSFKQVGKEWRAKDVVISEIVAAILAGREIGLQPMAALRSIQIIHNTPAMTALAMRGLVQSQGHEVWVVEQTDTKAVVNGKRRGSDKILTSTWTIDRAKKMNLTAKAQWTAQPQAMLVARASSECCRLTASDVLLGLPYSVEELEDSDELTDETPKRRTVKRRPLEPVPAEAPDLEPPADIDPAPATEPPAEPDLPPRPEQTEGGGDAA